MSITNNSIISHYRVVEKVYSGWIAENYLAEDISLQRSVTLKFPSPELASEESHKSEFLREARAASAVNHPNLIHIYEISEYQGQPFLVTEWVAGRTLRDITHGGRLPTAQALDVAVQVCEGLSAAHRAGVLHGSIRPAAVLIDKKARAKLADLGLSTLVGQVDPAEIEADVGYMAPEQVEGKPADQLSDVFSLGAVLYELLTGRKPFEKDSAAATLNAIVNETPEPLARHGADAPAGLQRILDIALNKSPEKRYKDVDDLLSDLKQERNQLNSREDFVRALLDTANSLVVCLDKNACITVFNAECERVTGYARDEILGRSWPEIFLPEDHRHHRLEDFAQWVRQHPQDTYEGPLKTKSGEIRTILWSNSALFSPDSDELTAIAVGQDITDRKQAEEKLRLCSQAVSDSLDGIAMGNMQLRVTYVNDAFAAMFGYSKEELTGKEIAALYAENQIPKLQKAIKATLQRGWAGELIAKRKDGVHFPVAVSASRVVDDEGKVIAHMTNHRDITERKKAEMWTSARLQLLNNLRTVGNVDACLEFGCRAIYEAGLFRRAVLTLHNHKREIINIGQVGLDKKVVAAARTAPAPDEELSRQMTQERFRIGHSYFVPEEAELPVRDAARYIAPTDDTGTGSRIWKAGDELFVPVIGDDSMFEGWLSVDTPFDGQRPTIETVTFLEETVDIVTQKMREIRTLEKLHRGLTTLQESEERFRLIAETSLDYIFQTDTDGITIYCSPAIERLLGYTPQERQGTRFTSVIAPSDLPKAQAQFEKAISGEMLPTQEINLRHKSGRTVTVEVSIAPVARDGEATRLYGIARDITHRKRADEELQRARDDLELRIEERTAELATANKKLREEIEERKRAVEALRDSEERFRGIFENTTIGMYRTTPDGRVLMANPALLHILGYPSFEELAARNLEEEGYEPEYPRSEYKQHIESEGHVTGLEAAWVRRDNSTAYVRESARVVRDETGKTLYYEGTVEDITDRKRAEKARQESEARYRAVVEDQTELICRFLPDTTLTFVNEAYCRYFGMTRDALLGQSFMTLIPDQDRQKVGERFASLKADRPVATYEHTVITPGGQIRWQQWTDRAIVDSAGKVTEFQAVGRDITERKRAEDQLRQATDDLRAEQEALTEKNIALKQILEHIEKERQDYKQRICQDVEQAVAPVLTRLKEKAGPPHAAAYEALETKLKSILAKDIDVFQDRYTKLTPRELEICELIKGGMASKQISNRLNLSLYTIHKHREQIRKKLDITNKSINLNTYLQSH